MTHQYEFHVQDVTCEKCEVRIREALESLPGAEQIELVRTPQDEAEVVFRSRQTIEPHTIESVIEQKSQGTTHHYQVRWATS
ncbi:MAG TPA: heavy-metal-associated domain-containing protein [Ktedonosporobacter sp.]|nr:heavy-metal-associated domain-containing protein [Ktedonosporobacter sp.]